MNEEDVSAHIMVLQVALATLIRLQPDIVKGTFIDVFRRNIAILRDGAIPTTYSDEWIAALDACEGMLLKLLGESIQPGGRR